MGKKYHQVIEQAIHCHQQGDNRKAYGMVKKLLDKKPNDPDALHFTGVFAYHDKLMDEARYVLRKRVMSKTPKHTDMHHHVADSYYFYAIVLYEEKEFEDAVQYCNKAIQHVGCPKDIRARAQALIGRIGLDCQKYEEAKPYLDKALEGRPQCPSTWELMGKYYERTLQLDKALEAFKKSQMYDPTQNTSLCSLSLLQKRLGLIEESRKSYQKLFERDPSYGTVIEMALALPFFYQSAHEMEAHRTNYTQQLLQLLETPMSIFEPMDVIRTSVNFQLAYHGKNDRDIQAGLGHLFSKALDVDPFVPHKPHPKIRVGFVSKFMDDKHTIGKLNNELIRLLPRDIFDVHIFHVMFDYHPKRHGGIHQLSNGDKGMYIPIENTQLASRIIRRTELDVMFYTDIGMDPMTYFLAYHRLAPVQCVTWGHPVTTGIPTMDYFISSHAIEPAQAAEEHYTESLVLLDSMPTVYKRPPIPTIPEGFDSYTKEEFGLSEQDNVYACPQSCFKFHPEFDAMLAQILERDPKGKLILIRDYSEHGQNQLMKRLEKTFGALMDRVVVLPRMTRDQFLRLMAISDVLLDPIHFGGGNTTYEGLAMGTPIITLPGEFMRGRVTYGCYQQMGSDAVKSACIAEDAEDYVTKAVELVTNTALHHTVKNAIMDTHDVLYHNTQAVEQISEFFQQAVDIAKQQGLYASDTPKELPVIGLQATPDMVQ